MSFEKYEPTRTEELSKEGPPPKSADSAKNPQGYEMNSKDISNFDHTNKELLLGSFKDLIDKATNNNPNAEWLANDAMKKAGATLNDPSIASRDQVKKLEEIYTTYKSSVSPSPAPAAESSSLSPVPAAPAQKPSRLSPAPAVPAAPAVESQLWSSPVPAAPAQKPSPVSLEESSNFFWELMGTVANNSITSQANNAQYRKELSAWFPPEWQPPGNPEKSKTANQSLESLALCT